MKNLSFLAVFYSFLLAYLLFHTHSSLAVENQIPRDKWALLIGVGNYQNPNLGQRDFALADVSMLSKVLKSEAAGRFGSGHVYSLIDEKASQVAIQKNVLEHWLLQKTLPNDMILLCFVGKATPADIGDDIILCPYDFDPAQPMFSGVSLSQLLKTVKSRSQAKSIVVVLDLTPVDPSKPLPSPQEIVAQTGITILSASSAGQASLDSPKYLSSIFMHYLVEAIEQTAGTQSLEALFEHLAGRVQDDARTEFQCAQRPELLLSAQAIRQPLAPIGVAVKSSYAPKKISVGHSLDSLALRRPDLVGKLTPVQFIAQRGGQTTKPSSKSDDDDDDEDFAQVDFGPYITAMKAHIQKFWHPPKGLEYRRVTAVYTILKDGSIINPMITESSGSDAVDKSALTALKDASPLPPLPKGSSPSVQMQYKFEWKVSHP